MKKKEKKHIAKMLKKYARVLVQSDDNDVILRHTKSNIDLCKRVVRYDGMDPTWSEDDIVLVSKNRFRAPFPNWELAKYLQYKIAK